MIEFADIGSDWSGPGQPCLTVVESQVDVIEDSLSVGSALTDAPVNPFFIFS
jgi:hypothetical protein